MPAASAPESPRRGLSIRGLSKDFFGNRVVSDLDLDVAPGEVVALLGENGAGKSTVSAMIAGIHPPTEGTMVWEGQAFRPVSPPTRWPPVSA